jgi:DNA-binding NtrC family response regulator
MPFRVVIIHDVPEFVESTTEALRTTGFEVVTYADTMLAIDAFKAAPHFDVLITRVKFRSGMPHGVSLASMARFQRPGLNVLFVGVPERREYTDGLGEFLSAPVTAHGVVAMVGRMLAEPSMQWDPDTTLRRIDPN